MPVKKEWFARWFDSPYYHILYKNRDVKEAEFFLSNLVRHLKIDPSTHIIDLACGRGRHAVYLNKLGYTVTGVDLSRQNIKAAEKFKNKNLHFRLADLRALPFENEFDYGFNLFTSFGYFDGEEMNRQVLKQFNKILKPNGFLLIDFFNAEKINPKSAYSEEKTVDGIHFKISKEICDNKIQKRIEFKTADKTCYFKEQVQLLSLADFEVLLEDSGFKITELFGNYTLDPFSTQRSERLIILSQKIS